jgi:hypothetical protein
MLALGNAKVGRRFAVGAPGYRPRLFSVYWNRWKNKVLTLYESGSRLGVIDFTTENSIGSDARMPKWGWGETVSPGVSVIEERPGLAPIRRELTTSLRMNS